MKRINAPLFVHLSFMALTFYVVLTDGDWLRYFTGSLNFNLIIFGFQVAALIISRRSRDIETEVLPLSELNLLLLFFQYHWLLLSLRHHQQEILFLKSFRTNPNCVHG
ncbi:hypothetical protein [uncultured Sphingobacterium sp.]|uniref:hypothetical protein n=1 Tax=uncultured Sphingobacterium sp. TaxID=182688 RepID=UPI0025FC06AA|nr:hypothetical protein [uncultured Sphingobacterium sp.]